MKSFFYSKTFWAAVVATVLEILTAVQSLPFIAENWAHAISLTLVVFIAINRALKDYR